MRFYGKVKWESLVRGSKSYVIKTHDGAETLIANVAKTELGFEVSMAQPAVIRPVIVFQTMAEACYYCDEVWGDYQKELKAAEACKMIEEG